MQKWPPKGIQNGAKMPSKMTSLTYLTSPDLPNLPKLPNLPNLPTLSDLTKLNLTGHTSQKHNKTQWKINNFTFHNFHLQETPKTALRPHLDQKTQQRTPTWSPNEPLFVTFGIRNRFKNTCRFEVSKRCHLGPNLDPPDPQNH